MGALGGAAQRHARAAAQLLNKQRAAEAAHRRGSFLLSWRWRWPAAVPCQPSEPLDDSKARALPGLAAWCMDDTRRSTFAQRLIRLACLLAAVATVAAVAAPPPPSMAAPTAATSEVQAQRARDAKVVPDVVDNLAPRRVDLSRLLFAWCAL